MKSILFYYPFRLLDIAAFQKSALGKRDIERKNDIGDNEIFKVVVKLNAWRFGVMIQ